MAAEKTSVAEIFEITIINLYIRSVFPLARREAVEGDESLEKQPSNEI